VKILVYCDTFRHVARFAREFSGDANHQLYYLVARRQNESILQFAGRQLLHAGYAILVDGNVALCRFWRTGRLIICGETLDSLESIDRVRRLAPDVGLHSMGVIYRHALIAASGMGILNAHIGLLPEFRGRSVFEWSQLYGRPTGVTVFFIDDGIDTGRRIVSFYPVTQFTDAVLVKAKKQMFALAPALYRQALERIHENHKFDDNNASMGKRYYVMSRLFLQTVERAFSQRGD
jgi:Formyl transferase